MKNLGSRTGADARNGLPGVRTGSDRGTASGSGRNGHDGLAEAVGVGTARAQARAVARS
ncbi:hypothetical protein [Blastococcus deserti]|uniref:Uncharacterized protein n=1 Tax=Blastococcus deserti TaxID=2259033 RepID=A0ABW4X4N1_9ACTN